MHFVKAVAIVVAGVLAMRVAYAVMFVAPSLIRRTIAAGTVVYTGTSQEPLGRPFFETGLGSVKKGSFFDACSAPWVFETIRIVANRAPTPQERTCPASLPSFCLCR